MPGLGRLNPLRSSRRSDRQAGRGDRAGAQVGEGGPVHHLGQRRGGEDHGEEYEVTGETATSIRVRGGDGGGSNDT